MSEFNPSQLTFARVRRRLTKAQLAKELGITSRSIQNYEAGTFVPDPEAVAKISELLKFPQQFFFAEEKMPSIGEHSASFRALSKMTETMKACALNAGAEAFKINDWIENKFTLPTLDLPDLSDLGPEEAAATLRRMWGLGSGPIPNMVHLLESKGVRVFSLAEEAREVDAFCTWYEGRPFVFLNTMKSGERSRFDAAHELGHLVRDVYTLKNGKPASAEIEANANAFAAAFLMPRESVTTNRPPAFTIRYLLQLKRHWGVSLVALAYRYKTLNQVSEWTYRSLCIEIATAGFRTTEPEPMERESSLLLTKVLDFLQTQGLGRAEIAKAVHISVDDINALTFGLTRLSVVSGNSSRVGGRQPAKLKVV